MSFSKQINELRANNWRTLSSSTASSTELGRLEAAQHTETARLFDLIPQKVVPAINSLHAIHQENRIAQAHSDFMMWKMQQYLDSDDAKVASADLLNGENLNRHLEDGIIANMHDLPYDMIEKANKLGGAYEAALHKLHLGHLAERYPAEMRSMMLKSDEMIDWVDPADGQTKSFKINEASSLGERMAAHNYLRNRYFSTHKVTSSGYSQAFLALSTEQGGSGFYQSIMAHETGKDGMFSQYETNAAIESSFKDQMTMYMAFKANPSAATFGSWYRTVAMGVNEKGKKYGHAGAHKKVREQLKILAETKGLKFNQIEQINKAVFNINGVDMTADELWPKYFGVNGELMQSYMKGVRKESEKVQTQQQVMFTEDRTDVIDRITNKEIFTKEQLDKEIAVLYSQYKGQDYDYTPIYNHWRKNKAIAPGLVESRVKALVKMSKNNRLITKAVSNEHSEITSHPAIQKILNEEKVFLENNISEDIIQALAVGFKGEMTTEMGLPSWKPSTDSGQIAFDHKLGLYLKYLKEGESPQKARISAEAEWKQLNGTDEAYRKEHWGNSKRKAVFWMDNDGNFPNLMKAYKGDTEITGDDRYKAYVTSKEIMNSGNPTFFPEIKQKIKDHSGGAVLALGERTAAFTEGDEPGPKIQLAFEEKFFPDGVDYNRYIEENGSIPPEAIFLARQEGISLVELINARQKAYGKPELSKEIMEELGDSQNIHTLNWAVRKALFSSDTDGYIQVGAEVARGSENPTESYEQATGNIEFGEISESLFGSLGDGDAYSYKVNVNFPAAVLSSFSPTFDLDFTENGQAEVLEKFAYMPPEGKSELLFSNPIIGEKLFDLTGDLKAYPLVPALQGSQFDIDNQNAIYSGFQQTFALEPQVNYTEGPAFTTNTEVPTYTTKVPTDTIEVPTDTTEVPTEVQPKKEDLTLKQGRKLVKGIYNHPIFDNWADSGLDKKDHLIQRVDIALLNAMNGDISEIPPELLEWVQPFLEQFNIDNTITE